MDLYLGLNLHLSLQILYSVQCIQIRFMPELKAVSPELAQSTVNC